MALNDIYLLQDTYNVLGQLCTNRYWYRQESTAGSASDLATAFAIDVRNSHIVPIVGESVYWTRIYVVNYRLPSDFFEQVDTEPNGAATGAVLPPNYCAAFTLQRNEPGQRNGAKRYSGIVEEAVDGVGIATAWGGAYGNLAGALGDPVTQTGTYRMVVVRTVGDDAPQLGTLPTVSYSVDTVLFNGWSSQRTRKP